MSWPDYSDILDRIAEPPKWWDENGVPRYCDFHPDKTADYAAACCLLLVECQKCRTECRVCVSQRVHADIDDPILVDDIENKDIVYGDLPVVSCCNGGWTMTAVPVRVLEFWRCDDSSRWGRVPTLEKDVRPDWDD